MMVESEAKELSEEVMLGAVQFAHKACREAANLIIDLAEQAAKDPWEMAEQADLSAAKDKLKKLIGKDIAAAYKVTDKSKRSNLLNEARAKAQGRVRRCRRRRTRWPRGKLMKKLEAEIVRGAILKDGTRIDGRTTTQIRPIEAMVHFLPRAHGSALFTRGETQSICTTTLGTKRRRADDRRPERPVATRTSCCTITSRPIRSVKSAASARRAAAKSATASSPGARCTRCCRRRRTSPTRSASCRTSPRATARRRWRRCAAVRCR